MMVPPPVGLRRSYALKHLEDEAVAAAAEIPRSSDQPVVNQQVRRMIPHLLAAAPLLLRFLDSALPVLAGSGFYQAMPIHGSAVGGAQ